MYYYFYERGRAIIIKSKSGSKALGTAESMLIGLVAGERLRFRRFLSTHMTEYHATYRIGDCNHQQPDLGRPNQPNRANRKLKSIELFRLEGKETRLLRNDSIHPPKGGYLCVLARDRSSAHPCCESSIAVYLLRTTQEHASLAKNRAT